MQSLTASYFWISDNKVLVDCFQLPPDKIMVVMGLQIQLPVWRATKSMVKNILRWGIRRMSGHVWGVIKWAINIGVPIWCNFVCHGSQLFRREIYNESISMGKWFQHFFATNSQYIMIFWIPQQRWGMLVVLGGHPVNIGDSYWWF